MKRPTWDSCVPTVVQMSEQPYLVVLEMYSRAYKNYNYLIVDPVSHQAVIVDPAWQMEKIEMALLQAGASLAGILITHSHPDHIHLAAPLAERHDCPIWMSSEEIGYSGYAARHLVGIDASAWNVGQMRIRPIATPGHTPGGLCYLIGDAVYTGDTLFAEGCGLCPDTDAAAVLFASLQRLKTVLEPGTRVFPGHSYGKAPGQLFSKVMQDNIYMQIPDRDIFVSFRLRMQRGRKNFFGQ